MPYKDRGKWRAVATVRGKRYSQAFDTKSEAKEWEIEERKRQKSKTPTGTDFSTHYNEYLDFCQLRYTKNTQVEKVAVAKRLLKFMGENPPIKDITPSAT